MNDDNCPDEDELLAYAAGQLPTASRGALATHIDGCDSCSAVLAEAARALASGMSALDQDFVPQPTRRLPAVGDNLGRYRLVTEVGRGAMGVVFAAEDPDLGRRVAVKVVRTRHGSGELEARLLLEARAMARLSHPNVVSVYDIGTLDENVWIAMELVDGRTLGDWLREAPRGWRAILDCFLAAGDGLAAAHAVEVIHRDFKPENVLVDKGGRVRVTDFGLARVSVHDPAPSPAQASSDLRHTHAGSVLGTPAYMAPEQLRGGPVDARADVFAFGASLYSALYGGRPYPAATLEELAKVHARGVPVDPPASAVPAWVRRAVMRAVAADPAARFPTMAALLAALRDDPAARLRRVGTPLAAAIALLAAGIGTWYATTADARTCRAGASVVDTIWNPGRSDVLHDRFVATGQAFAPESADLVTHALGERAAAWRTARLDTCAATWDRGDQSQELLDLRLECLDRRLGETEALVEVFTNPDAKVVEKATSAVGALVPLSACDDDRHLRARIPLPTDPSVLADVRRGQALTAQAVADGTTGRLTEGVTKAEQARQLAESTGYAPLAAEATLALANLRLVEGALEAAETLYAEVIPLALRAGDDRVGSLAASSLAGTRAEADRKSPEGMRWVAIAEALGERSGVDQVQRRALNARALVSNLALDSEKVRALLEAQAEADRRAGIVDDPAFSTLNQLAWARQQAEDYAGAVDASDRAQAMSNTLYGATHPRSVFMAIDRAGALTAAGRPGAAVAVLEPALEAIARNHPDGHVNGAIGLIMLATALPEVGRIDEAIAAADKALEGSASADTPPAVRVYAASARSAALLAAEDPRASDAITAELALIEAHMPGEPTLVLDAELKQVIALEQAGQFESAQRRITDLLPRARAALDGHTLLGEILDAAGRLHMQAGRFDRAIVAHQESLALQDRTEPPDGIGRTPTLLLLGEALLRNGDRSEAAAQFDRARTLLEGQASAPLRLAEARFGLARTTDDPARATSLAADAKAALRDLPHPMARRLEARIAAWEANP